MESGFRRLYHYCVWLFNIVGKAQPIKASEVSYNDMWVYKVAINSSGRCSHRRSPMMRDESWLRLTPLDVSSE